MAIDLEAAKAVLQNRPKFEGSGGQKNQFFKIPKTGSIKIRFLPPLEGEAVPGCVIYKHWNMPEVNTVTCLKTWKKPCPICEMLNNLKFKADKSIEDFEAKANSYHNVLILEINDAQAEDPKSPYILQSGEFTYYWLLEQITNIEVGDITDPYTGSNVKFKRKSPSGPLDRSIARKESPIASSDEEIQEILSKMADFRKIWKEPTEDDIRQASAVAKSLEIQIRDRLGDIEPRGEAVNTPKPSAKPAPAASTEDDEFAEVPLKSDKEEKKEAKQTAPAARLTGKKCFGHHVEDNPDCDRCLDELECQDATDKS